MTAMSQSDSSSLPLKHRLRSSICYFCCFSAGEDRDYHEMHSRPTTFSHCRWSALNVPEMRDRCLRLINRAQRKVAHNPVEFSYDPLSYTLNFEDEWSRKEDEGFAVRNFLARIPATPERPKPATCVI